MTGPHFFIDRSLGRRQVPNLLRDDGWDLVTLSEHYGIPHDETVQDVEWLRLAGEHAWPVLMKDERIRYRPAERAACSPTESGRSASPPATSPLDRWPSCSSFTAMRSGETP